MNETIINALQRALGPDKILIGAAVLERYQHIWEMDTPLQAQAVVLPTTTEEIATIFKICNEQKQAVVIHGGLTNLVGSTETVGSEVVVSMEKLNKIIELDEQSRTITVEAGVILENVHKAAKAKDLLFPLNYGARGSAQVGGAISTNAGGLRVLKYGMMRNLVLGLEVVLPDGTIISSLKKIIKDNSGYDLKHLFIGSEGTLGVVTKAVLKLVEAPKSRNSALVGINKYKTVIAYLKFMDQHLMGSLSAFELIWKDTYAGMTTPNTSVKPPLPYGHKYYVLLETSGSHQEKDNDKLQELLVEAYEQELIEDAVIADTQSDNKWFWRMREDAHALAVQSKYYQSYDISLPINLIGKQINKMRKKLKRLKGIDNVYAFGHVADGNIHFLIGKKNDSEKLVKEMNDIIYTPLQAIGGSISAEHGIGLHKKGYLHLSRTPAEIQTMQLLKKTFDPNGILNPGKVID